MLGGFHPALVVLLMMGMLFPDVEQPEVFGWTTLTNCSKYLPGFFVGTFLNGILICGFFDLLEVLKTSSPINLCRYFLSLVLF